MVEDTREAPGAGPIRPLNIPTPIDVVEDEEGGPLAFTLRGRNIDVTAVDDMWEIADEWWRPRPIARRYYQCTLEHGGRTTVFRDLAEGGWYEQRE